MRVGACQLTITKVPGMLAAKKALTPQRWTSVFGFPKKTNTEELFKRTQTEAFEAKMFFGAFGDGSYSDAIAAQNTFTVFDKIENIPHCKNAGCLLILV